MSTLTVYKASAGSGKTFTLATEYIRLLIENPYSYKNILAVTFTNKATEEMKTRILSQLYGLWKRLPESADYMSTVTRSLGVTEDYVSRRAETALHDIIHNYSYFRVQTIDTFFQTIMRNLARELDLVSNYRVTLNVKEVEEQAVDNMIKQLNEHDKVLRWIVNFIASRIDDGDSWKVTDSLKKFAKHVKDNDYRKNRDELNRLLDDDGFFYQYTRRLRKIRQDTIKTLKDCAQRYFDGIEAAGLAAEDLSNGKKNSVNVYYRHLKDGEPEVGNSDKIEKFMNSNEVWGTKSKKGTYKLVIATAEATLRPLLIETETLRKAMLKPYMSATVVLKNIDSLRLLGSIDKEISRINERTNTRLLADTPHILNTFIEDSDAPFIFEKTGAAIKHIMIDEFQDTDIMQWSNFKTLLDETMSHADRRNLIVGDVKQSIYRWRSGDWRMLNNIERLFDDTRRPDIRTLNVNYRSERNIVTFNNAFFAAAAGMVYEDEKSLNAVGAEQIRTAYNDVEQRPKDTSAAEGMVKIMFLGGKKKSKNPKAADDTAADTAGKPEEPYDIATLKAIERHVNELIEAGIKPNEIAILVRSNINITRVAKHFEDNRPDINIVSDMAFMLDASPAVCLMVAAMYNLAQPDDLIREATLSVSYQRSLGKTPAMTDAADRLLPDEYTARRDELRSLPLPEMAEQLYGIFVKTVITGQDAYISAFFDCVNNFVNDMEGDLNMFLDAWESDYHKNTIPAADGDGIRMTTIHKSKGLEYDHVIIPFCDWELHKKSTIWIGKTDDDDFNRLPVIPVDYSDDLAETVFAEDYLEEHTQVEVDNLNLLYVAFTRARRSLLVIGKADGAKTSRSHLLQRVAARLADTLPGADFTDMTFTFGTPPAARKEKHEKTDIARPNPFTPEQTPVNIAMTTYGKTVRTRQSGKERDFIDAIRGNEGGTATRKGLIIHDLFARIATTADIPRAIDEMRDEGLLYDTDLTAGQLKEWIDRGLEDERVSDWFSGRYRLLRECSIVFTDDNGQPQTRRPDRVMTDGDRYIVVDFKSRMPRHEHREQVKQYTDLIRSMGHENVEGYLWYVMRNDIIKVC